MIERQAELCVILAQQNADLNSEAIRNSMLPPVHNACRRRFRLLNGKIASLKRENVCIFRKHFREYLA